MSCLGLSSLWKNRKKIIPTSTQSHNVELRTTLEPRALQSPQSLSKGRINLEHGTKNQGPQRVFLTHLPRREGRNSSDANGVVKPSPIGQCAHQKPWFNLTDEELRAEYKRCMAKAPEIGPEFLWDCRRDSLDEGSVLAAKGVKCAKLHHTHQARLPLKLCEKAGELCDRMCHCSDSQPRKCRAVPAGWQAHRRQKKSSKPPKIPAPSPSAMQAFSESVNLSHVRPWELKPETNNEADHGQQEKPQEVKNSGSITSDEFHREKTSSNSSDSSHSSSSSDRRAAKTWWDDITLSYDPNLDKLARYGPSESLGWSGIQRDSAEWRFFR
ncbi:hypothetical protein F4776DRAFT_579909 [Hypoxylon sp. NC0597]|nr:hypothetical protein F4776DRAFT_579909 [Hypoxylon sp. NC0597]